MPTDEELGLPNDFDPDADPYEEANVPEEEELADAPPGEVSWDDDDNNDGITTPAPPPPNIPTPQYPARYVVRNPRTWRRVKAPPDLFQLQLWPDQWPSEQVGFFRSYMDWSTETTDAPEPVHLVSAMCALSTAVGRRWRVDMFDRPAPNIYALVIADSASRKSSAMSRALSLLPETLFTTAKLASVLAFTELLQENPTMLWYQDEADTVFHAFAQANTGDFAAKLVEAYNGERVEYKSKAQGNIVVRNPFLTLLTGSALEWLQERGLTPEFLRGGLFARCWVIPARRQTTNLVPPQPDPNTRAALRQWLEAVGSAGPFIVPLDKYALDLNAAYQEGRGPAPTPQLSSIWNRAPSHIAKLALLYHISLYRGGDEPIRSDCMEWAINFFHNYVLPGHRWVMERLERTTDPVQETEMRILMALETAAARGMPLQAFYAGFGSRAKVKDALANLHDRGKLSFWSSTTGQGRPRTYVVLGLEEPERTDAVRTLPSFVEKFRNEEGLDRVPDPLDDPEELATITDDDDDDDDEDLDVIDEDF